MAEAEFTKLEQIFNMTTPADLAGKVRLNLGGPADKFNSLYSAYSTLLENDARGVWSVKNFLQHLNDNVKKLSSDQVNDANKYFDLYSTLGFTSDVSDDVKSYQTKDGIKKISGINEVIGKAFSIPKDFDVMLMSSRSPFFHPAMRNTRRIELFLNSMPSIVLSQMSAYLDVEFQTLRNPSDHVQQTGQLRFLLGGVNKPQDGPNKAILDGTTLVKDNKELSFAGMEMFTSPQTLVNPLPNIDIGTGGVRYTEVLDPFRPFASIESLNIKVTPTVGIMTYKKASLVIKLHDRSRLAEISDLIRPQSYSNTTVWLTYGWRAPTSNNNPYFEYINNTMLAREAYGLVNSSFSFDQVGQVVITLELATKGLSELRNLKVSDTIGDAAHTIERLKRVGESIAKHRKQLKLDSPEGVNKEVRVFQVLDAAEVGEFPNMKANEALETINKLEAQFKNNTKADNAIVKQLISELKEIYKQDNDKTKFGLKERIQTRVTDTIKKKFDELIVGPDPFCVDESKKKEKAESPLIAEIKKFHEQPQTKVTDFKKNVVSFGKLFSVFAVQSIVSTNVVDELQVFFYSLNEQCGPVSGHSIADFPVDLATFQDQYRDHVVSRGGEKVTLEEFLQLVINAQVLDNRAIGYGLRQYYEPYDPKNKDAQVSKNKQKEFESAQSNLMTQYGSFKKPHIEMYIETSHEKANDEGTSDILMRLSYSAKDGASQFSSDIKEKNLRRIMRIHIYDKQVNPHLAASQMLRSSDGRGFVQVPSTDYAKEKLQQNSISNISPELKKYLAVVGTSNAIQKDADDKKSGVQFNEFVNGRQVKDLVSKFVPTITYGANGTIVSAANLSSKAEPLLSTVNMQRSNSIRNTAQPNGSGEGGIPLRVIPAQMTMSTLGCPLATLAQMYFLDFNTGTSLDNLYICTALNHVFTPGKFETQWTFGFADAYGVFEGAPNIIDWLTNMSTDDPKK
jgi:hypothetical protein